MKKLFFIIRFIWNHPLASRNRRLAFVRLFRFHLSQKINPYPVLYPLVENSSLLVKKGMAGATGNIYTGLLEFNEMAFILHVLRSGDIFADLGANIGVYTILAAKNTGARVLAVEPIGSTFVNLTNNVYINEINQLVTLFQMGVGEKEGRLSFTNNMDTVNHVLPAGELHDLNDAVEIEVIKIDTMVAGNEPVIIKLDVEGFEGPALLGAKNTLTGKTLKGIIIELNGSGNRYGFPDDTIHEMLLSFGFRPFHYDPFSRTFTLLNRYGPYNTIYLRDVEWMVARVQSAKKYTILNQQV